MEVVVVIIGGIIASSKVLNQSIIAIVKLKSNYIPLRQRIRIQINRKINTRDNLNISVNICD